MPAVPSRTDVLIDGVRRVKRIMHVAQIATIVNLDVAREQLGQVLEKLRVIAVFRIDQ